jgi:hypothetical protein
LLRPRASTFNDAWRGGSSQSGLQIRCPKRKFIQRWQEKFPVANVAYHTGASGLVVVDADSHDIIEEWRNIFGATPGRIKTRRVAQGLIRFSSQTRRTVRNDTRGLCRVPAGTSSGGAYGSVGR